MQNPDHLSHSLWYARPFLFVTLCVSQLAIAQTTSTTTYAPPTAVSSGSLWQITFSLLLVLAAVALVAWILKRFNLSQHGTINLLKIVSSVSVGQRERILLVEINDTWLVVGVAPGQVQTLHNMPKSTLPISLQSQSSSSNPTGNFSAWLKQMMEKRNAP